MKKGDTYYGKIRIWSEEECADSNIGPYLNPDEIFIDIYVKLVNHIYNSEIISCEDAWTCFASEKIEVLKDIINETNITYCTKYIRENFRRIYDI